MVLRSSTFMRLSSSDPLRDLRLIDVLSIELVFAPIFLLAKLTRDFEKRNDLFGAFNLCSLRRVESGGEAVCQQHCRCFQQNPEEPRKEWRCVIRDLCRIWYDRNLRDRFSAGCIYDPVDALTTPPTYEFLQLGTPIGGCEMRIVNPEDGVTPRPDGQSGELQVYGPMVFVRYYNNPEATSSSFVEGWLVPHQ
ncbi:hypothetical protein J3R83DRAFT_7743 [Lanmaoa asiatica]|nr:hypothetical protein J3R83DRAFT_7743 [Lanmaoa asiatica]